MYYVIVYIIRIKLDYVAFYSLKKGYPKRYRKCVCYYQNINDSTLLLKSFHDTCDCL